MSLFSENFFKSKNCLGLLFSLVPLSFVAGNLVLNLNVLMIVLFSFFVFGINIFKINYHFLDKLVFFFFFTIILSSFIHEYYFYVNDISKWIGYVNFIKSLLFLRFLLLYLIIRYLIENGKLELKYFFITSSIICIFVCLDIFYQFFFKQDIFGYKIIGNGEKLAGPFGDELIAGGFIQRFSFFSFFVIPLFLKDKFMSSFKLIILSFFIIISLGIILSGNRMPLLIFLLSIMLFLIFEKSYRIHLLTLIMSFLIIFVLSFNLNQNVKNNFLSFYYQISNITKIVFDYKDDMNQSPQYYKEFSSFYHTWKMHKFLGGGMKNFRYYCHVAAKKFNKENDYICNMHPHNYYLEILT